MISTNKVSIITPVYNTSKYLNKCLDSLVTQSYKNIEIILIDDGSTDLSGIICETYATGDDRIIVKHKSNNGIAAAVNDALEIMSGKYLFFVDSDDYLDKDAIKILVGHALKTNADIVQCTMMHVDEDGNDLYADKCDDFEIDGRKNILETYFLKSIMGRTWAARLYKSALFHKVHLDNGRIIVDLTTVPVVLNKAEKYIFINNVLYYCLIHGNSVTYGKLNKQKYDDLLYASEFFEKFIVSNCLEIKPFIYYNYAYTAWICYYKIIGDSKFNEQKKRLVELRKLFKQNYKIYKSSKEKYGNPKMDMMFKIFNVSPFLCFKLLGLYKFINKET